MQPIKTEADFQTMLAAERAIALICFEWSGQSKMSEKLVKQWEQEWLSRSQFEGIPFFQISPDDTVFLGGWVGEHARSDAEGTEGGFGSVLWLRNGKVARFARYAAKTGTEGLSRITEEVFKD